VFCNLPVLFLISVKPEYVKITKDDSTELQNASTIGPFTEGEEITLTCESGGGKPIPNVVWWNGTNRMIGKLLCISQVYATHTCPSLDAAFRPRYGLPNFLGIDSIPVVIFLLSLEAFAAPEFSKITLSLRNFESVRHISESGQCPMK
jgi:hypothetical protein